MTKSDTLQPFVYRYTFVCVCEGFQYVKDTDLYDRVAPEENYQLYLRRVQRLVA